jgi:hypothetical protein
MNEWGIPDWRDPSNYGDVKHWSTNRWRWEFYRRRDDLREFFDRWAEISFRADLRANAGRSPNEPGFLAFGQDEDAGVAIRKFGYGGIPNPRIGAQPAIAIVPYEKLVGHIRNYYNPKRNKSRVISVFKKTSQTYEIDLEPSEFAIKFDLNKPLASQIDDALRVLRDAQRALHGRLIKSAQHQEKWLRYLRTLDARAENVPWSKIAMIDSTTAQTPQTARDTWKQADALRFGF